ncbi:transposase zinc-binding domain-containing protein [Archangium gephyra]|uniref:transposase zinc-binding domain-containing protein n=1 Tax=Archangium gephyra TaxID=48 RepID=UPI001FDEB5A6
MLAHGFSRVRCESCKDELLVAFSCKGRGGPVLQCEAGATVDSVLSAPGAVGAARGRGTAALPNAMFSRY